MLYESPYLIHYGTQGAKWGVRKYQYKDMTLTPEGRKRYGAEYQRELYEKNHPFRTKVKQAGEFAKTIGKKAKKVGSTLKRVGRKIEDFGQNEMGWNMKEIKKKLKKIGIRTALLSGAQLYMLARSPYKLSLGKQIGGLIEGNWGLAGVTNKVSDYQSPESSYRIVISPFKKKKIRKIHSSRNTYMGDYS